MAERELIWVELELSSGDMVANYNGQIYLEDYNRIERGFTEVPFIKVFNLHWYELSDEDQDDWKEKKKLIEYGEGDYSEYDSEALIKIEHIIAVFRLKHGPESGPKV
jgi:hypothetical protein